MPRAQLTARRMILAALIVAILPILQGCSATRTVTKVVKDYPPSAALAARPEPVYHGETWRDLAKHAARLKEWGGACEADKAALRAWAND